LSLAGRRAVVTGGGRGIGLAVARRLAAAGAAVTVLTLEAEEAAALSAEAPGGAGAVTGWAVDVSDPAAVGEAAARYAAAGGGPHLLVNGAGWTESHAFLDEDAAYWRRVLAVNLESVLHVCRAFLPGMVAAGGGSVVNVASGAGRVGQSRQAVYAAAKGGVVAFTRSLARELAAQAVRVNAVAPGPTRTRLLAESVDPDRVDRILRGVPLRRLAEPEEVAAAVVWLLSDEASYVTGQVLAVDGGLTMV
jgi:2-hydroxycyclohexanecarboxyl-CoA dehydrogenase